MSEENVEIVRRAHDAVARRDTETVLALYDAEVEWDWTASPASSDRAGSSVAASACVAGSESGASG